MAQNNNCGVSLRPWPYPFNAGLAICSDIDYCSRDWFLKVHRILNQRWQLPVADSFFGMGASPEQLAYFKSDGSTPSADAPFIERAIEDGLIDCLHSWGDYNGGAPEPRALRSLAENLCRRLGEQGMGVPVWINHGNPHNRQNLFFRLEPAHEGDLPASPYYTADLLPPMGISFTWLGEKATWPLSASGAGQQGLAQLRLLQNRIKNLVKTALGRPGTRRKGGSLVELAQPYELRDGRWVWDFTRFFYHPQGRGQAATRLTLRYCLAPGVLERLGQSQGCAIVYTHLARPQHQENMIFAPPDQEALAGLARAYQEGRIWVCPTAVLLRYQRTRKTLEWQTHQKESGLVIELGDLLDPVSGRRPPLLKDLAGLTFYTPDPRCTQLLLAGRLLAAEVYGPDQSGRSSLGLPPPPPPRLSLLET